jgi:hypothetical protein
LPDITDLMAACDALASAAADGRLRRRHAAHLREGLSRLADEIRDLRAQRESLESQVMTLANEEPPASQAWEKVIILLDDDDDPDLEPVA